MAKAIAQREGSADEQMLRDELAVQRRQASARERQLERYAADLRDTFKAERARAEELQASYVATVRALVDAVEARDAYTGAHAGRVAAYGLELARRVEPDLACDPQTEFGFLLHDVGKIAIPDEVLHKADDLGPEEQALMRSHPQVGYEIVRAVGFLAAAAQVVRHHHERWDGEGYPDGLSGQDIPLAARIFSVADALDAITTDRPYRPGQPIARARAEIRTLAGTQFDPAVVARLDEISDERLEQIRGGS
jgi:ribonuclease P protein subunit RPR2